MNSDDSDPIQATADEALTAKLNTIEMGYYKDPFSSYFINDSSSTRRSSIGSMKYTTDTRSNNHCIPPIIRRGTYARVCCMDRVILSTLDHLLLDYSYRYGDECKCKCTLQVLVLGAGKDTSYFRLLTGLMQMQMSTSTTTAAAAAGKDKHNSDHDDKYDHHQVSTTRPSVRWYEVDQPDMIRFKRERIRQYSLDQLKSRNTCACTCTSSSRGRDQDACKNNVHKKNSDEKNEKQDEHHLISFNLNDPIEDLIHQLTTQSSYNFDVQNPTLILLECVQMYLPDRVSRAMLTGLSQGLKDVVLAVYDPILLGDKDGFGKVMLRNLQKRKLIPMFTKGYHRSSQEFQEDGNIDVPVLLAVRDLSQQLEKLHSCGFTHVYSACDMLEAYQSRILTMQQRHTAQRCEMLDELEEWTLLMKHYSFVVVSNQNGSAFKSLAI